MTIAGFQFFTYRLPLNEPLRVKGRILEFREGVLVKLTDEKGYSGFGEAAPIPGISRENLSETLQQLRDAKESILNAAIPETPVQFGLGLAPSVSFALESAFWMLKANAAGVSPARWLGSSRTEVRINALLDGNETDVAEQARTLIGQGFSVFKLKVGADLSQDAEKVRALSKILPKNGVLRLDANQGWSYDEAVSFVRAIPVEKIEYFEEPFADVLRIPEFFKMTKIPTALDESLWNIRDCAQFDVPSGVSAVIIKPTMTGGIERSLEWARMAAAKRIKAVISSSFESGVGIGILANLAALAGGETACGLDTLKWFSNDLVGKPLVIANGFLRIPPAIQSESDLNNAFLTEAL